MVIRMGTERARILRKNSTDAERKLGSISAAIRPTAANFAVSSQSGRT